MKAFTNPSSTPVVGPRDLKIRRPSVDQVGAVVALFEGQLCEHGIRAELPALRAAVMAVVGDPRHGFVLVAQLSCGAMVGVAYASALLSLEHAGVSGWLEELYVLPPWRGQGVGSRLLGAVIDEAASLGWRALDLEVEAAHRRAEALYLRHAFRPHARRRFWRPLNEGSSH